ncbi:MAG: hypothetical protein D6814_04075 [Calditrichaeota bacterium]|nr:MAG: hypothetical protein D6814_04075 [Calditrichota bacterium]
MSSWLARLNIDPQQFRALLKLAWRQDMRSSKMGFGWQQQGRNPKVIFLTTLLYYLLLGGIFAWINFTAKSVFVGSSLTVGGLMFLLGGILMVEYTSIVISPDDYPILGHLPVSSRTYFFAKLTNMLAYILVFDLILGGPSLLVHALRGGLHPFRGLMAFAAYMGTGLFVGLLVVALYGQLLRVISPGRLKNLLSYMQFGLSIYIYTAYLILPKFFKGYVGSLHIQKEKWLLLLPTTWFASLVEIGYKHAGYFEWVGAAIAVGSLVFMSRGIFKHVSLEYAQRIALFMEAGRTTTRAERKRAKRRFSWLVFFRQPEDRVVARLVVGQFRYDTRFRLSVVSILPLLLLYFYLGLEKGALPDPFLTGAEALDRFFLFFFAILMLPIIIKQNLDSSDAYEAAWVFYASPARLPRLVIASRNLLFMLFSAPALLFLIAIFLYYFRNPLHALGHVLTIGLLTFIVLQVIYFIQPRLPFSEPKARGSQSSMFTLMFLVLPIAGILLLSAITRVFYQSLSRMAVMYSGLFLLSYLLEWLIRRRISLISRKLNFSG